MEIIGGGVRGIYKISDLTIFDGFVLYYSGTSYLTAGNTDTIRFFNHIKRK